MHTCARDQVARGAGLMHGIQDDPSGQKMNAAGFYGRTRPRDGFGMPSGPPDMPTSTQWEKMSEALTVLQTAQQSNLVSMRTVIQRIDALAKDFDEFKKQGTTLPPATAGHDGQSSGRRIPSELSVSRCIVANAALRVHYIPYLIFYKPLRLQ